MPKTQLKTELKIFAGMKFTLSDLADDLNAGWLDALYYATEQQMHRLVEAKRISEDLLWRWGDYQEEAAQLEDDYKQAWIAANR